MRKAAYPSAGDCALAQLKVHPLGCWNFTGRVNPAGYGMIKWRRRHWRTHRAVYELLVGPIPEGLVIDHLCFNKRCMNPAHLEAVTARENTLRQIAAGRHRSVAKAALNRCTRGHAFDEANTYRHGGKRRCRTCELARARANYSKRQ